MPGTVAFDSEALFAKRALVRSGPSVRVHVVLNVAELVRHFWTYLAVESLQMPASLRITLANSVKTLFNSGLLSADVDGAEFGKFNRLARVEKSEA